MNDLTESWKAFILTVLYPWVLVFLIFTSVFVILQFYYFDLILNAIFSILISLSAGILGGIATKRWENLTEEKIITNKGRSAIRNLWHILGGISLIKRRVDVYRSRYEDETYKTNISEEVIKTYLEEIIEKCFNTEVEVLNSIEDWSDILPEFADVKPKIAEIQELNNRYNNLMEHAEQLDEELEQPEEKTEDEIKKLKKEKNELRREIVRLRNELKEKSSQLGTPLFTGSVITSRSDALSSQPGFIIGESQSLFVDDKGGRISGVAIDDKGRIIKP